MAKPKGKLCNKMLVIVWKLMIRENKFNHDGKTHWKFPIQIEEPTWT
jgi:hypothetical protein